MVLISGTEGRGEVMISGPGKIPGGKRDDDGYLLSDIIFALFLLLLFLFLFSPVFLQLNRLFQNILKGSGLV